MWLISSVLNQNPQRMTTGGIKILLTQKERYMEKVKLHFKHNDCNYFFLIAEPLLAAGKIVASDQAFRFFHCFCLFAFFCFFPHIIYLQFWIKLTINKIYYIVFSIFEWRCVSSGNFSIRPPVGILAGHLSPNLQPM